METIFQTVKVRNKQILITLPDDFEGDEVDIAISEVMSNIEISQGQIDEVRKRHRDYLQNPSLATDITIFFKEIEQHNEL